MTAPASSFRPDIEGLRAVAVGGVVAFHFGMSDLPGGFIGVDIFFVISGYLITRHLMQEIGRNGTVDLWRFYGRRARRLLPASLLVVATTLAAGYFILAPSEQQLYAKGALFASSYVINLWLLRWSFDYFAADTASNPFLHFWSLSVEEQFYLLWPAFLLLAMRLRPGPRGIALILGVVAVVSFAASAWMTSVAQPWAFYFSPLRAWEFAVGGLVSLGVAERWASGFRFSPVMGWTGIALIATAYLSVSETDPFPGVIALLPVAGTAMLLLSGARQSAMAPAALLSLPPFQWTGKLSYSLYLWHWPVIVYATILWPDLALGGRLACLLATIALSYLSYRFVENPVRLSGRLSAGSLRSLGLAALLTSLGVTLSYGASHLAARSVDPDQKLIAESAARSSSARQIDTGCVASLEQTRPRSCNLGAAQPRKTIVLFGDSHADHWSTPLAKIAQANNWRVVTYLKSSCSVAAVPTWNVRLMRAYSECDAWRQTAMKEIADLKPDAVIVAQFSYSYVENDVNGDLDHLVTRDVWANGLRTSLAALSETSGEVVLLRDVPVHKSYLDRCVARSLWQGRSSTVCDTPRQEAIDERVSKTEQAATSGLRGVRYVDLTELFCNETTCPAMIDGKLTFRDRHHIATPYAATLAGSMQRAIFGNQVVAHWQ
jgi:peptidoglycan/LPS O-acetylase OafA/YrhL